MNNAGKKILILMLCVAVACVSFGCGRKFDASGYTQALLDLNFQGETSGALQYVDGVSKTELMQQYKQSVDAFVAANITNEIEMSDAKTADFADLVSRIFMTMRYEVKDAEKTGKREYEVPVSIWPSSVFEVFRQSLVEDSLKIAEKVEEGGYTGTEEEIDQQVLSDIINHAYELLESAAQEPEYGDEQTVILHVRADGENEYYIDEDDMDNLIVKILRLDEIGD